MSLIKEYYKYKIECLKQKKLTKREKALKAFLEGKKLTEDKILRETDLNRVF